VIDHPDDLATRAALVAAIRQLRVDTNLSRRVFGRRLGVHKGAVAHFEAGANPLIGTAQRYARAGEHRLTLHLHGLPDTDDGMVATYRRLAATAATPADADGYHRAAILEHLRVTRLDSGRTARSLCPSMGCSEEAVRQTEIGRDNPLLATYQRLARANGGWLGWGLTPVTQLIEGAA
jgi:transcriptional regulator with XRE-family HTH domain